mmetsp:Transcript_8459/g.24843  ORF Transcript_8459/g.24843 Transcript_8459/m.24843 type:complete len:293 (+) Transcript_8459:1238-2116(+)
MGGKRWQGGKDRGAMKKRKFGRPSSSSANIPYGAKGFLISSEVGKEKQTARDVMRLMLDIYDDIVSPDEKDAEKIKEGNDDGDDDEDAKKKPQPSVEDALKSEIDSIKEEDKLENRKFKIVDLGLRACIFVLMSKEAVIKADPSDMVVRYLSEVKETSLTHSRFIERILPVQDVCFASSEEIKAHAKPLVDRFLPNVEVDVETKKDQLKKSTFSVIFSSRHNNSIPRMEAIDAIAKQVSPDFHKVDLGDPRVAFTCDLIKGCCVLGVAKEWKKFSKYNARILGQNKIQENHM